VQLRLSDTGECSQKGECTTRYNCVKRFSHGWLRLAGKE
jgi:hypothetical protein